MSARSRGLQSARSYFRRSALAVVMMTSATAAAQAQQPEDQAATNPWFVRVGYSPARVLAAGEFELGAGVARATTLEVGRQTDGSRSWHRVYNYPAYGVGFYAARFDRAHELGHPFAAYGFFSWPFPVSNRIQVTSDFGLGISWNWNEYDPRTNPTNTTLGSDVAY